MRQTVAPALVTASIYLIGLLAVLFLPSGNLNAKPIFLLKLFIICFGTILASFLTVRESRRQRRSRNLEYDKSLFSAITENLDEGIGILDHAGCFQCWSSRFSLLLGETDRLTEGCRISDVLPESICRFIRSSQRDLQSREANLPSEIFPFEDIYLKVRLLSVSDKGSRAGYAVLLQDQTRQVHMEQELNDRLKEIRYHIDTKDSLLSNVSHELKTPLNALFGFTHILEETALDENQKELVSKIGVSSDCLNERINDILYLSSLKKGALSQTVSYFWLKDLMDGLFDKFSTPVAHKGIRLIEDYQFDPDLCLCLDHSWMEQILSNLIGNACKFTDIGYVRICVCVLKEFEDTAVLKFTVEDTGIGIKDEDLPNIFEDFYQTENHLTKEYQGAGLGLPICKYLAENMGGNLSAESTAGVGSCFHFTVTAPKVYQKREDSLSPSISLEGHGEKVLVVEDASMNFEVVSELLSKVNICCDHAASGLAALKICEQVGDDYYKAIFMDIHMPIMDGYETAEKLKARGFKTPIIALTATSMDAATQKKHRHLFSNFIFKPFKYTQLYNALIPYIDSLSIAPEQSVQRPELSAASYEDPYIGRNEAIENMGGNPALYEKHLAKFKNNYAEAADTLEGYLKAGDRQEAKRLAHSVKGLAATLGLARLTGAAKKLETAIDENQENLDSETAGFRKYLAQVTEDRDKT